MKKTYYLLDTHALLYWHTQTHISEQFVKYLDKQKQHGALYISSISFWEIALLVKKKRISLPQIHLWKNELINNTNIGMIEPSATEMIDSTLLPDHHKDPFDRLLIAQAKHHNFTLVTQDQNIQQYDVTWYWM